jgi:small-conductance mechanosensitive channel
LISTAEQLHAIIRRFDELDRNEREILDHILRLKRQKFTNFLQSANAQLSETIKNCTYRTKKELIEKLQSMSNAILREKAKLTYYEVDIDASIVAQAKLACPENHPVQILLDGYLARALGEKWPQVKTSIDVARKISE